MVYLGFTDEMLKELEWLSGKELKNMSFVNDEEKTGLIPQSVYGNLFLGVDNEYVEVGNLFKTVNYFGKIEDISMLFCKFRKNAVECLHHRCNEGAREYIINDKIEKIIIIRDNVEIYQSEYEIKFVPDNDRVDENKGERELIGTKDLGSIAFNPYIYNITLDQALVLECRENTYIFLRGSLFTEEVLISVNRNYMGEICTVDEVQRYWKFGNEGLKIKVKREKIEMG